MPERLTPLATFGYRAGHLAVASLHDRQHAWRSERRD